MNVDSAKNKIIWAIDPTQNPADAKNVVKELIVWSDRLDCDIQPITIFSESVFNFPRELAFPWREKFDEITQNLIDGYLKKIKLKNLLPAKKIFAPSTSKRKMATELAKYADNNQVSLIVANTRTKKGWNALRLGGFAETLVTVARKPVLLIGPNVKPSTQIPNILFPTDFSPYSEKALKKLIPWARAFHSKIALYNQVETPPSYVTGIYDYLPLQTVSIKSIMKDMTGLRHEKAQQWLETIKKHNVDAVSFIQSEKNSLSWDILDAAKKKKADVIALASRSGPISQFLLGSVAKDILLYAKTPVLVFHQDEVEKITSPSPPKNLKKFRPNKGQNKDHHAI